MFVDADICGLKVGDEHPVRIMGVINLSQESFYKSSVMNIDSILEKAHGMVDDGATILDIGARSTWLLAKPVISREEEMQRLVPALDILKDNVDVIISVDTMFADIAEKALELGADMINDVSGFKADERMLEVLVEHSCPAVAMATEKIPGDPIGMEAIMESLSDIIRQAHAKGMDTSKLVLDPAIGKWVPEKIPIYDFETIDQFERLKVFRKPLLAAISRKSCIDAVLHRQPEERLYGTLAATAIVVHKGAHIIRTHDVPQTMDVVKVAAAMRSRQSVVKENGFEVSVVNILNPEDAVRSMKDMGVTVTGAQIMKKKSISRVLRISNITTTEALIIKQEILARGGDAALERDAVSHETENTDILIMGTILQLEKLAKKLECQARNLPAISRMILHTLQLDDNVEHRYLREL
ncbi:dihydropteroate synthase [Methanomethylovorans sp.]|uniref:dihydropteroate synthase n=1 Tax=Methanomethylovorans sp. TaxID=2758717 RepID=UPI003D14F6D2